MVWLLVWQVGFTVVNQALLLASPAAVGLRIAELARTRAFWGTVLYSMSGIMVGYLLATVCGAAAAFLAARFSILEALLALPMKVVQSTPVASFVILALVWIRRENLSVFIAFLMVLPMIYSATCAGLRSVDKQLLEMARVFDADKAAVLRNITLPAVLPHFLAAARTGLGFAWKAGIAGEVIAIPRAALGTQLYNAKVYLETTDLFAWSVVIILLSMLLEHGMVRLIEMLAKRAGALAREVRS